MVQDCNSQTILYADNIILYPLNNTISQAMDKNETALKRVVCRGKGLSLDICEARSDINNTVCEIIY